MAIKRTLTAEKSIWEIYKTCWKFPANRFNIAVSFLAGAAVAFGLWFASDDPVPSIKLARYIVATGLSLAPSILGFLIAGFTIFVTITRMDIFVMMAKREKGNTGESYLKYALLGFLLVFIHYMAYLFACFLLAMMGSEQGIITKLFRFANAAGYENWIWALASLLTVIMAMWSIYIILLLKSFVFNTYQIVTTIVAIEL